MNSGHLRQKLAAKRAQIDSLRLQMDSLEDRAVVLRDEADAIPERLEALQQFNHFLQLKTFAHFESIVNRSLAAIFPDPYTLRIVPEIKRKQFEVRFVMERDGESLDPLIEVEYGVLDVVSFALRIAFLSLKPVRRLLIMDEPFKWVGAANRTRLPALLEALSTELGFQIILVTHLPELIDERSVNLDEL